MILCDVIPKNKNLLIPEKLNPGLSRGRFIYNCPH